MKKSKWILLSVVAVITLVSLGCTVANFSIDTVDVGPLINESETVELGDANEVRVDIKMGAGELNIDSGTDNLMEADFRYNVADWEPDIDYQVRDGNGRLTIRQPNTNQISMRTDARYEWDLLFNGDVPLDMRIQCGAGNSDVDLGELNVTHLDVKLGAGDFDIDLSGNDSLRSLEFDIGAGDVTIDLTGAWTENVDIDVQGGVGKTTLLLPKAIGVRVNVSKAIGDVDASGLYDRGGYYVNEAYGESDVTVEINIQAGIGQIDLMIVE